MNDEPPLIAGKDLKKNTDYWLTADYWIGPTCSHNVKVRLARHFKATGVREKFAAVVDQNGAEYVIHPNSQIFTEEDKRNERRKDT